MSAMTVKTKAFLKTIAALGAATVFATGCSTAPTARVSDPAVYTMTTVVQAANSVGHGEKNQTAQIDLQRYFAQSLNNIRGQGDRQMAASNYFADANQRQKLIRDVMNATPAPKDAKQRGAAAFASTTQPTAAGSYDMNSYMAYREILESAFLDTPADRLDAARDLYQGYLLKTLTGYARDSRASQTISDAALRSNLPYNQLEIIDCIKFLKELSIPKAEIESDMAKQNVREAGKVFDAAKAEIAKHNENAASQHARIDALVQMRELARKNKTGTGPSQNEVELAQKAFDRACLDRTGAEGALDKAAMAYETAQKRYSAAATYLSDLQTQLRTAQASLKDTPVAPGPDVDRLVLLVFQTHIEPGTASNEMAGVRLKVMKTQMMPGAKPSEQRWPTAGGKSDSPELVKFVALYPSRSSDVMEQVKREAMRDAFAAVVEARSGGSDMADVGRVEQRVARQKLALLSRMSKVASFADATQHEIGWNFYPTNMQVTSTGAFDKAWDLMNFRFPQASRVDAFIKPEARECAAYVLVPRELQSITFRVDNVSAAIEGSGSARRGKGAGSSLTVTLPPWNEGEAKSLAVYEQARINGFPDIDKTDTASIADPNDK